MNNLKEKAHLYLMTQGCQQYSANIIEQFMVEFTQMIIDDHIVKCDFCADDAEYHLCNECKVNASMCEEW